MTRDDLKCLHEPFGDAFFYGPERLSLRFEEDQQTRLTSGFEESTYQTVLNDFEAKSAEVRISLPVAPFSPKVSVALQASTHVIPDWCCFVTENTALRFVLPFTLCLRSRSPFMISLDNRYFSLLFTLPSTGEKERPRSHCFAAETRFASVATSLQIA